MFKKKYYCIKQYDITDCGAACLATISKQHGFKTSITKIREVAGTDTQGTNVLGLITAAEGLGYSAKGVKGTIDDLTDEVVLPAIAHVVTDKGLMHYVVIHKIDHDFIVIADPAKGIEKISKDDFAKTWTGILVLMTPTVEFKTGDETKGLFSRFLHLLKPQKKLLIHVFTASILNTALGIFAAFYFKFLMDDILPYGLKNSLHIITIGIILLNLVKIGLGAFRSHLLLYMSQRIDIPLILGYYNHVLDLPMNFFGTRRVGEIVSRFMDAGKVRNAISGAVLTIMIDVLMAFAGGIILYMQNPTLFFIAFTMLVLYGAIVFGFNTPLRNMNRTVMENNSDLTSYLMESLNGIDTVKSFNAEQLSKQETEKKFIGLLKSNFRLSFVNNVRGTLTGTVGTLGNVIILWVGALYVMEGELTIGQLLVFNSLMAYFIDPVSNLIELQPMLQTAIVASDRLGEILDLEVEKSVDEHKKYAPELLQGHIAFNNIKFRYGTRKIVLDDVSLNIEKGRRIALVGESGSGKTTLVKLLLKLYEPEGGEVLLDGIDIRDYKIETLRNKIAYVPQETFLFSGSIYDNLTLGAKQTSMEKVIEACKLARAHDFINDMPRRYQSVLEENGSNLSGGQRQRLAIARAILKNPDIIVLDEATSSLDSTTEKAIEETIESVSQGITTIIIAHRLSTIMRCDQIFVMEKGQIVESGGHKDLMKNKNSKYYEMWKNQIPETYEDIKDSGVIA